MIISCSGRGRRRLSAIVMQTLKRRTNKSIRLARAANEMHGIVRWVPPCTRRRVLANRWKSKFRTSFVRIGSVENR